MPSISDVYATVKLDFDKSEESRLRRKIGSIDTSKEGKQVATRFGVGFNGAIGNIVSRSAGVFAAGFAAVQGAKVFGGFIKDAAESEKIARITANAIKATGGAAKISAGQVSALAESISNKTAIDDEQIQTAANMLLTFKNIRNETGKGNDIFNRSTQAVADLSVQFGGMEGASKQVGKALNDPVKGISALSKAGVTFTEQQKEQIRTLVKSGDVLGAQKIILKEIEGQVGGAAAAAADPMERLKVIAGNLSEQIGGFLLPTVNKFATFVNDTGIPGIKALFSAFQEGDVTSDGFIGVMERIGVTARGAFGFFKTEILPRLQEFGSFIVGTAAPAVASFGTNIAASLGPAVKDVFGFFKTEVLPRLKDFGSFLGESVLPKVGEFAAALSKNKDFLVPFAGTLVAIVAGLKAWAIIQGVLNVVLAANPIGLLIVGIAALAGGLVYAYKNSDKFRAVVDGAFKVVAASGQFMWNTILKPLFGALVATFKTAWENGQKFSLLVIGAFNALKGPAIAVFRFIMEHMLSFIGGMLQGAAKAFGWVPGIGEKLKNASSEFNKFKDATNKALAGIKDEPVNIKVDLAYTAALGQKTKQMKFATGGPVFGAGTATSDSIPALLSNNEHVWTAKEVQAAGGHKAMEAMRKQVVRGYANGGVVLRAQVPSTRRARLLANAAAGDVDSIGSAMAKGIAAQLVRSQVNPGLAGVLQFVKSQVGKPYVWGGVGPGGYDCSGLVSAAINVALGRNPYSRLGATGSMPWSMFKSGPGAFQVGWFKGNPGHTAATVNGVNIESRGGRGVVMGRAARGAGDRLFTNRAAVRGFAAGGAVGDAAFDILDPRGKSFIGKHLLREVGIDNFDTGRGKRWESGTLGVNMSGKTERVFAEDDVMVVKLCEEDRRRFDRLADRPIVMDGKRLDQAVSRLAMDWGD